MGLTAEQIAEAIGTVATRDADVHRAVGDVGLPEPRIGEPGFASLLRIMVAQQLSTKAAATIRARLEDLLGETTPANLLARKEEELRGVGLSRQKVGYARELAEAAGSGRLDFAAIPDMGEDDAIAAISSIKGFGRWSAEIYLLFCEGRQDVWPAGDLGLQAGLQRLKRLEERPKAPATLPLVEPWRPHRRAMAIFLWHYYARTKAPL